MTYLRINLKTLSVNLGPGFQHHLYPLTTTTIRLRRQLLRLPRLVQLWQRLYYHYYDDYYYDEDYYVYDDYDYGTTICLLQFVYPSIYLQSDRTKCAREQKKIKIIRIRQTFIYILALVRLHFCHIFMLFRFVNVTSFCSL